MKIRKEFTSPDLGGQGNQAKIDQSQAKSKERNRNKISPASKLLEKQDCSASAEKKSSDVTRKMNENIL